MANIIDYIKPHLEGKPVLIDAMGGGFNVGINGYGFEKIIYNDINHIVRCYFSCGWSPLN